MFRISNVKVAGVVAAGALTLGAAGAYAASNPNNTIPVNGSTKTVMFNGISLTALSGATLPATQFKNQGECVSWFAQNKDFALTANGGLTTTLGSTRLAKNFHGKLMSQIGAVCKTAAANATKSGSDTQTSATETETETADTTDSTDSTDAGSANNQAGHGHGHSHGQNHLDD